MKKQDMLTLLKGATTPDYINPTLKEQLIALLEAPEQHEKIKGYRTLTDEELLVMNEAKMLGEEIEAFLGQVRGHIKTVRSNARSAAGPEGDENAEGVAEMQRVEAAEPERWLALSRTHFQEGLMALVRSIAQPGSF